MTEPSIRPHAALERVRRRPRLRRWGFYALLLAAAALCQTVPGFLCVGAARPLFILPLALAVAWLEPPASAALFGALCGLVWDLLAARPGGYLALVLLALCLLSAVLPLHTIRMDPGRFFWFSLLAALVLLSLDFLLFFVMPAYGDAPFYYLTVILPTALFTALAGPVCYCAVRRLHLHYRSDLL